jgi:hypothetical protein
MSKDTMNLMVKGVPVELMEKIRKQADKERRTIKAVVLRSIEKYLEEQEQD